MTISKIIKLILYNPKEALKKLLLKCLSITSAFWADKHYLTLRYRLVFARKINWTDPQTFNEKLNWLKLYYHNPIMTILADKYLAKEFILNIIGEKYIVPNYSVCDSFDEIDFDSLPNQFVLKCTHDSSGAFVCKDKSKFDIAGTKTKIDKLMERNWYYYLREWVYKDIKPRIIIDTFLDDHSGSELLDYKFLCFNGVPKVVYITNKGENIMENYYDMSFKPLEINRGFPRRIPEFQRPKSFDEMVYLAVKISKDLPFVRVDFFCVEGKVYFGECTFYDWGGMRPFEDYNWDKMLGEWISLPEKLL